MIQVSITPIIKTKLWKVTTNLHYHSRKLNIDITVPKGFKTDLASIPSIFTFIVPKCRVDYATASVVHDWMLKNPKYSNSDCTTVFREILKQTTTSRVTRIFSTAVDAWYNFKLWRSVWT